MVKRRRFEVTEGSLKVSQELAKLMGVEFDKKTTLELTENLYERYFLEIVTFLNIPALKFESGALRNVNAFAHFTDNQNTVVYDEQLDFWLLNCCHLTLVAACEELDGSQYTDLIRLLLKTLEIRKNPYLHEEIRSAFHQFIIDHPGLFREAHLYSRAMNIFIICHELAHVVYQHTKKNPSFEQELEADAKAVDFFKKIVDGGKSTGYVYIDPKLAGAPILLMHFFEFFNQCEYKASGKEFLREDTHPLPIKRANRVREMLQPYLNETAVYLLDGCIAALNDIAINVGLKGFGKLDTRE
jgi:hypothetical protein